MLELDRIYEQDCRFGLRELDENSIDAVITDPPYELGFMGKQWDNTGIAYNMCMWQSVLRALKPGGHLLSFGGSRTYHRMACAVEDAGFEIRDQIMWVYGSGFPKSLNIWKAVDKLQGNERDVVGKGECGYNVSISKIRKEQGYRPNLTNTPRDFDLTKGTSDWEGWGTALKPAHEPIVLARKPLSEKTVAENVLRWSVGGLNIDGCRISTNELTPRNNNNTESLLKKGFEGKPKTINPSNLGRFPANFIHDGSKEVLDVFPEANNKGHFNSKVKMVGHTLYEGGFKDFEQQDRTLNDSGSASRFFYCAKVGKEERDKGLNYHPTVKPISLMEYLIKLITRENQVVLDPFIGSGTTALACKRINRRFIGFEINADYHAIAEKRVKNIPERLDKYVVEG
jgi:site-specific DNA-methyltransferase (adenine-specific)